MAKYLYRHPEGPVYSFTEPFRSYPIFRPEGFKAERLRNMEELNGLVANGSALVMTDTPASLALPADMRATLLYSEFPLTRFGFGAAGADYIRNYSLFAARHRFLKLLPLYWYTLYRVERSATIRS